MQTAITLTPLQTKYLSLESSGNETIVTDYRSSVEGQAVLVKSELSLHMKAVQFGDYFVVETETDSAILDYVLVYYNRHMRLAVFHLLRALNMRGVDMTNPSGEQFLGPVDVFLKFVINSIELILGKVTDIEEDQIAVDTAVMVFQTGKGVLFRSDRYYPSEKVIRAQTGIVRGLITILDKLSCTRNDGTYAKEDIATLNEYIGLWCNLQQPLRPLWACPVPDPAKQHKQQHILRP